MPALTALKNYTGPGKVALTFAGALEPMMAEGENGQIKLDFEFKRKKRYTASQGYLASTLVDTTAKVSCTPFDSWKILPTLFPPFLGVTTASGTGFGAGVLKIGTRPHDIYAGAANGTGLCQIWTVDGRMYSAVRSAVIKPPTMNLGNDKPLFTGIDIACLTDPALAIGVGGELIDSAAHVAGTAGTTGITESAAADPASWTADFINGHWVGVFGISAGFGGDGGLVMDAELGWELIPMVKYSPIVVQGRLMHYKLDSVEFGIKARIQGPTHTALLALVDSYIQGGIIGGGTLQTPTKTSLVLSGPADVQGSTKTVTLPDCVPWFEGSGFEFGGTSLNTGEVIFVTRCLPAGGPPAVPPVLLQFSA